MCPSCLLLKEEDDGACGGGRGGVVVNEKCVERVEPPTPGNIAQCGNNVPELGLQDFETLLLAPHLLSGLAYPSCRGVHRINFCLKTRQKKGGGAKQGGGDGLSVFEHRHTIT